MKPRGILNMQIGKNGLTQGFIESVKNAFGTRTDIKVSVLKSATRSKQEIEEIAQQILNALGKKFTCKTVGFTIFFKKWRKVRA